MGCHLLNLNCFSIILVCVLLLPDLLNLVNAQGYFASSRATYTGSPECDSNPSGACGYGEYGRKVNGGIVTGVSRLLYKNGSGCGACYQVKCSVPNICNEYGTSVVVTDHGEGDRTDFILSAQAFSNLANPNMANDLLSYGVVDVEYRRISCSYPDVPDSNLMIKIKEQSQNPGYIAMMMLYNAGQYDITGVDIWDGIFKSWRSMRKSYGAVWDLANPKRGDLMLRVQVTGAKGIRYLLPKTVIPSDWTAGATFDLEVELV